MTYDMEGAPGAMTSPSSAHKPSPATLAHEIGDLILDKKGVDLQVIDIESVSTIADFLVIATGASSRQVVAIAKEIEARVKAGGGRVVNEAGMEDGWWVLLDLGDVIVHLMQDDARRYYDLENLWADGNVVRRAAIPEDPDALA
ncbi:MAG: ribosome silencing factor [Planctomycetes bacterium]|nr:ribosome silencing factor [Planctomycetota bacterium]